MESVLEKNPPKQGLKLRFKILIQLLIFVLEKNPPKQGLKLDFNFRWCNWECGFREKSTKTRIETSLKYLPQFAPLRF